MLIFVPFGCPVSYGADIYTLTPIIKLQNYEYQNNQGGASYKSPVCTPVEVFSEGVLCESFGNESFKGMGDNDSAPSYGSGEVNNGWY